MKKGLTRLAFGILTLCSVHLGQAQTSAMDFQGVDCNGNMQHLFADLDAGNAVILEFFMTNCSPCIDAASTLELMKTDLMAEYPGKIKAYAIGFNNTYSCTAVSNWVNNNGVTSIPMDSGATQVAYYGGMGMPTIVILGGGNAHTLLHSPYVGFSNSDTTTMASGIRDFLNTATAIEAPALSSEVSIFPNPAHDRVHIQIDGPMSQALQVRLIDLSGRVVEQWQHEAGLTALTLSTATIPNGSYVLQLSNAASQSNHKLMIVH